jgi:hypothetical protein
LIHSPLSQQCLFIVSSIAIVFLMMRGHTIGRLNVAYNSEEDDCKVRTQRHIGSL